MIPLFWLILKLNQEANICFKFDAIESFQNLCNIAINVISFTFLSSVFRYLKDNINLLQEFPMNLGNFWVFFIIIPKFFLISKKFWVLANIHQGTKLVERHKAQYNGSETFRK
jgi:hypothetical protein